MFLFRFVLVLAVLALAPGTQFSMCAVSYCLAVQIGSCVGEGHKRG